MNDTTAASTDDKDRFGKAFEEGFMDFTEGCDEMDNPYEDADGHTAWQVGWEKAKAEAAA